MHPTQESILHTALSPSLRLMTPHLPEPGIMDSHLSEPGAMNSHLPSAPGVMESHCPVRNGTVLPSSGPPGLKSRSGPQAVQFASEPRVEFIQSSWQNSIRRSSAKMAKRLYETFVPSQVTDDMIREAARLFNENYGTWGPSSGREGQPVKLGSKRLRDQYLGDPASSYTRVTVDGALAGHAFVCRWQCGDDNICWVTQLVIHKEYRGRGLAAGLLSSLRVPSDDIYGIVSSHPFALLAATKAFGTILDGINAVPLDFISKNADAIIGASTVPYVRDAKLCGTLFDPEDASGLVSGVDTSFFVDHGEPLEALALIQRAVPWPFGSLPDGKEFLLLLRSRQSRLRFSSASVNARDPTD